MKESKNDSKSQQEQKGQQKKNTIKSQKASDVKPYTEDTIGDSINNERTKMPRRETRTPVAGVKSTSQEKNQNKKGRL